MAVKLRLRRMGRKKRPIYSVVATDSRSPRDGRFIEDLGRYTPVDEPAGLDLKQDRILYWLEQGALPSETVRSLLSREGLLLANSLRLKGKTPEEIQEAIEKHRVQHAQKESAVKTTPAARRRQALNEERKRVAEEEARNAKARAEAEAEARRQADEARRRVQEEAARAQEEAKRAQEEANRAQVEADQGEPAAETPVKEMEAADSAAQGSAEELPRSGDASEPEVKKEAEAPSAATGGNAEPAAEKEIAPETMKEEKAAAAEPEASSDEEKA